MNENSQQLLQAPGEIAQVFVAALQGMQPASWPCKSRFKYRRSTDQIENQPLKQPEVEMSDALRIKSAEFWLKLGEVEQALLEIRSVPELLQKHPSVIRVQLAIVRAASQSQALEI